jgi:hypothetical protein
MIVFCILLCMEIIEPQHFVSIVVSPLLMSKSMHSLLINMHVFIANTVQDLAMPDATCGVPKLHPPAMPMACLEQVPTLAQ